MILESQGEIAGRLRAIGTPALPAFLWAGRTPAMFDAGMTFMGPAYLRDLQEHLGDARRLRYLLITHSHFDHCGAAPYLRKKIPFLKIGASARAAEIWRRPNAVEMIRNLSREAEEKFRERIGEEDVRFDALAADLSLEDGMEIDLEEGERVRVVATPGHTRDAVSYYLPGLKALVCGEAAATLNRDGSVRPEFLASGRDYLESLEKLRRLDAEILIMAHLHILAGEEVQDHLLRSIQATRAFRERIEGELAAAGGNQAAAVEKILREDYEEKKIIFQEKTPYRINLTAQVKTVAEGK